MFIRSRVISNFDQCALRIDVQRPRSRPQLPVAFHAWGIIDTGATASVISRAIYDELDLEEFIPVQIDGPGHEDPADGFQTIAQLLMYGDDESHPRIKQMPLVVAKSAKMRHGIILGMDALDAAVFTVDGPNRCWSLDFVGA